MILLNKYKINHAFTLISFSFDFLLNIIDTIIDAIERIIAVKNIKSNENDEGNDSIIPLSLITDWLVCIYIAARAGPTELPTILNMLLIPIVTPTDSLGEINIIMFMAPTADSDNPADNMP